MGEVTSMGVGDHGALPGAPKPPPRVNLRRELSVVADSVVEQSWVHLNGRMTTALFLEFAEWVLRRSTHDAQVFYRREDVAAYRTPSSRAGWQRVHRS
jgi:hypothetical protein